MSDPLEPPLVSVIIPVFNAERYLDEALASVYRQGYPNLETIAVNDGSTDGSLGVLRRHADRVRIIDGPNRGCGGARNLGIREARGEYLAFLDADDYWADNKLACQLEVFRANPGLELCFASYREFASPDWDPDELTRRAVRTELVTGAIAGTCLVRKAAFMRVGYFSEQWRIGEFVDWFARAQEAGVKSVGLGACLLHRRNHRDNSTVREKAFRTDYIHVIKAALDRRREQRRCRPDGSGPVGDAPGQGPCNN